MERNLRRPLLCITKRSPGWVRVTHNQKVWNFGAVMWLSHWTFSRHRRWMASQLTTNLSIWAVKQYDNLNYELETCETNLMEPTRLNVCRLRVCVIVRRKTWGAVPFTPNRGSAMTTDTKSKVGTEKERGLVWNFCSRIPCHLHKSH
jgi:hypothetical protein